MKNFQKLSRAEMKNVTGGLPPNFVNIYCNVNGVKTEEHVSCSSQMCTSGQFISYVPGSPTCAPLNS